MPDEAYSTSESGTGRKASPRERVRSRLQQAGLGVDRGVDLLEGSKAGYTDHTDPSNQYDPREIEGNYGILVGDGLVIVDLDDYRSEADGPGIDGLPETLTAESPHGGEHRYYHVVDGNPENQSPEWGDLQAENVYVVGPGSVLEDCSKDWHDCSAEDEGHYSIKHDLPIAKISVEDLPVDPDSRKTDTSAAAEQQEPAVEPEVESLEKGIRDRLSRAEDFPKWGDEFTALKEGRYNDAGFGDDRSRAEFRLVEMLGWLLDDDIDEVAKAMEYICRQNPQTNAGTRKWLVQGESSGGNYHRDTLERACDHDSTYDPPDSTPPRKRPTVSHPTASKVFEAVLDLKIASSEEVTQHEAVDRSQRQVRRALKRYLEEDRIKSVRDGRQVLYYFDEAFVPDEARRRLGL